MALRIAVLGKDWQTVERASMIGASSPASFSAAASPVSPATYLSALVPVLASASPCCQRMKFGAKSKRRIETTCEIRRFRSSMYSALIPVSYTHLTLPTICSVQISVVAVSLKKKKKQATHAVHGTTQRYQQLYE
eukprot:TRINITY_DN6550_c0_g1_i4.p5 TRINITY_DN6550_c0_g1~~TRINITY_DN6550_c0_g1_i4.p5  ORF type:complete len:135 (-),score=5.67 TRINITY_DN6550_c0_g1_i4:55-459(-)